MNATFEDEKSHQNSFSHEDDVDDKVDGSSDSFDSFDDDGEEYDYEYYEDFESIQPREKQTVIMEIKEVYHQEGKQVTIWVASASFVLFLLLFSPSCLLFVPLLYLPRYFNAGYKPIILFTNWLKGSCTCAICYKKKDEHEHYSDQGKISSCERITKSIRNMFRSFVKKI